MIGAALITLIPTLLFWILLPKIGLKPKSTILRISLSWFAGMYIFTIIAFLLSLVLSTFTTLVLFKAMVLTLILFILILDLYFWKDLTGILFERSATQSRTGGNHAPASRLPMVARRIKLFDLIIIVCCFLFSFFFFTPQLAYQHGAIFISPVFWDFHWLMSLTQTFAYGDNFPPQNEAFAGLPANYHYFWMVIAAIYEVGGLNLVQAINIISILGFSFLLLAIIGLSEELFHNKLAGIFAALFTVTSSSGHVIQYFLSHQDKPFWEVFQSVFTRTEHPFFASIFTVKDLGIIYNGTFYNLFYFLEERQMILGAVYLVLSCWIIAYRKHLSNAALVVIGGLMGAYFLWHLYITLMIAMALVFVLIFDKDRKHTLLLFAGFSLVFIPHLLNFRELTHSEWFNNTIRNYPKFNPSFSDQRDIPFTFSHAFKWYIYSYGLKLILLPAGLIYLWWKNKKAAVILSAIVIPTFIAINTIQLSPPDIYENHKWLRPMNIIVDLIVAATLVALFFPERRDAQSNASRSRRTFFNFHLSTFTFSLLVVALTASGILELMLFFNSKPTKFFSYYPSALTTTIQNKTEPKAVFVGQHDTDIYLAGRKLFVANHLRGHDSTLNRKRRIQIVNELYKTADTNSFCRITKTYGIDYVQFNDAPRYTNKNFLKTLPNFEATTDLAEKIYFVDTKKACTP